jgi:hypothetical protein
MNSPVKFESIHRKYSRKQNSKYTFMKNKETFLKINKIAKSPKFEQNWLKTTHGMSQDI